MIVFNVYTTHEASFSKPYESVIGFSKPHKTNVNTKSIFLELGYLFLIQLCVFFIVDTLFCHWPKLYPIPHI